ncbi:MAG: hypothetical protein ACNA70_00330 [Brevefilum sp.]
MESRKSSLIKPKLTSPFQIDFEWWKKNDRDWRVYLRSFLCGDHQRMFEELDNDEIIDWVDPKTAEVKQVDGLQHTLISHCAKQDGFIGSNMALVDSVFRVFLSNGNKPLTPEELGEILNRPPTTILRTFSGFRVYKGIRPLSES